MPARFTVNGSDTTISFEFTAPTTKIQTIVGIISLYLWNTGAGDHGTNDAPILYTSLNNQQKLNLVFQFVLTSLMNILHIDAFRKAADASSQDVDENLSLF